MYKLAPSSQTNVTKKSFLPRNEVESLVILCYVSLPSPLLSSVFCVELPTMSKSWYSGSILFARLLSYATGAKEFSLKVLQGIKI